MKEKLVVAFVIIVLFIGVLAEAIVIEKQERDIKKLTYKKEEIAGILYSKLNELDTVYHDLAVVRKEKQQIEVELQDLQASVQAASQAPKGWNVTSATVTAYSPLDDRNGINSDGEGEITSIGLKAGYGIFAVDPKRIPYGSKIVIMYENGTIEEGIAGDTGGAMRQAKGIKIDVFRRTFDQAIAFGNNNATVLWKAPGK